MVLQRMPAWATQAWDLLVVLEGARTCARCARDGMHVGALPHTPPRTFSTKLASSARESPAS